MRAVRVTAPIYIEITTPANEPVEGYARAREFLNEQYRLMRSMRGSAHLSPDAGDDVRLWCPGKDEVRIEMTEVPDGGSADEGGPPSGGQGEAAAGVADGHARVPTSPGAQPRLALVR